MSAQPAAVLIRHLGTQPYVPVWHAMQAFTAARDERTVDEVWCLEHPPVFTQGQAGKPEHVLAPGDIPVVHIDRGGQVTYHGPGQLVVYTLIDLTRLGIGVKALVTLLEETLLATLIDFDIRAARRSGAPGIYLDAAKIAAIGLRIKRGRAYHGISLNVDMDLEPFGRIRPCGLADTGVTQLRDLAQQTITIAMVRERLVGHLCRVLRYTARTDTTTRPTILD